MKRLWMAYDLGIDGDYDNLYRWLDDVKAVECGDGFCSFKLDVGDKLPPRALLAALKRNKVKLRGRDRIYLVWRRDNGSVTGEFVAGSRRRAPWAGYATESSREESDDASE